LSMTIKINDIAINDLLAPKLKSIQSIMSQLLPKNLLRGSHVPPQFSGDFLSDDDITYGHTPKILNSFCVSFPYSTR
jgi:hypothetical protein